MCTQTNIPGVYCPNPVVSVSAVFGSLVGTWHQETKLVAVYMKAEPQNSSNVAPPRCFPRARSAPCSAPEFKAAFPRQIQQLALVRLVSSKTGPGSSLDTVCLDSLSRNNEKADHSDDLRIFLFDEEFGAEDMDEGVHPKFCDLFFYDP